MDKPIDIQSLDEDSATAPIKRGAGSLLIAIVVAALFLLGALGVGLWMVWQKGQTLTQQPTDTTSTKDVKSLTWVAPATLPAAYAKRDQNTHDTFTTYYYNEATVCGLTTVFSEVSASNGATAKEAIVNMSKEAALSGVTVASSADGVDYDIADTDGETYPFKSLDIAQDVDVQGVSFKKQYVSVAFKQFGSHLASISMTCKEDTWEVTKPELTELLKQFTVKLER